MNSNVKKILTASSFQIETGRFVYAKVAQLPDSDAHFMVCHDADEITVVTKEENVASLNLIERNKDTYQLIALNVSVPFYSVGFLAAVSNAIAEAGMNILIVSTYSKDYILVKDDQTENARTALQRLGLHEVKDA